MRDIKHMNIVKKEEKIMYENKKIFILGMARSGYEVAKVLAKHNNQLMICDKQKQDEDKIRELVDLGAKVVITDYPQNYFDESYDLVVKNPGIKYTHPLLEEAREYGIPIVNELEVAYSFFPKDMEIIGVTGSNGKTTTTNLINEMLKADNKEVVMAGNMGIPVCSVLDKLTSKTILLLEISIQQLCDMHDFKTNVSVLTNITPTHIDFLDTYENYKNVKKRIFNNHTASDLAILNKENSDEVELTKDILSTKLYFSSKNDADICIKNAAIYYKDEEIIKTNEIKLQGMHNYENAMCAIGAVKHYGVSNEAICKVLREFGGVEHRLEFVRTLNDISYYNDSKATNTVSTNIALKAFDKPTILIMGGLDRGHSFEPLNEAMKNVKLVVCYGQTKERIENWANGLGIEVKVVDNLHDATMYASSKAVAGDVVLLSPACASWDQYKCFEDRGTEFKTIVNDLK